MGERKGQRGICQTELIANKAGWALRNKIKK